MKGFPRIWNDWLALIIILGTPVLWVYADLNEIVLGCTISVYTLVAQFYFRRAPDTRGGGDES